MSKLKDSARVDDDLVLLSVAYLPGEDKLAAEEVREYLAEFPPLKFETSLRIRSTGEGALVTGSRLVAVREPAPAN